MIKPVIISELLLFSTIRIEVVEASGKSGVGTGFIFNVYLDKERNIPVIITNKHVVRNATDAKFALHIGESIDDDSIRPTGQFFTVKMDNFEIRWVMHPDDKVDLCAMPFRPIIKEADDKGKAVFHSALDSKHIKPNSGLEELSAVEDVIMVGYPIGLWDTVNNLPIIRRGITATHPAVDFNGASIGMVDMACFPGSSGSPILIANEGSYTTKSGELVGGNRVILLGVLYAGPQMTQEGSIGVQEIPTRSEQVAHVPIPIHLGYYVKAKEINVLGEHLKDVLKTEDK